MADSITSHWREALALERRAAPEFYTAIADVEPGPHRDAICFALSDLGLAAVFCIEGVPTVGFLNEPDAPLARIDELHRVLWNQGLMSLLLVLKEDEVVAYSLVQRPFQREEGQRNDPRIITTLSLLSDALELRQLIDATESGNSNNIFLMPTGRVVQPGFVNKDLKDIAAEQFGLHLTSHMLRHSFATTLYEQRKDIVGVAELLGHKSISTTERYLHVSRERTRQLIEGLNKK